MSAQIGKPADFVNLL
ncbi:hypothetical protein PENPOL_c002G08033 [Penicillium polonicum]|uniref:Uncharacterized protein n=1 Tax=Penicillium polonicum TaxID=60169 RepID=A0A1V6NY97_PENPO|nr:hypothetical protein PENPOL_c002G08033 [Penicillium polonicum]